MSNRTNKKNTKIFQEEYDTIKELRSLVPSDKKVSELTGRGASTIFVINKSKNWEDYRRIMDEYRMASAVYKKANPKPLVEDLSKVEPVSAPVNKSTTVHTIPESANIAESRKIQALNRIADQLERLADAWEASPSKKGLFR